MKLNTINSKVQKGFLSLELIIVVGVVLVLGAIAAGYAFKAQKGASVDEDNRLNAEIARCIKDSRTGVSYADFDLETLIKTHCLDDLGVVADDDALVNTFSGSIDISVVAFNGNDDQGVEVTSSGYSAEQCVQAARHRVKIFPVVTVNTTKLKTLADQEVSIADITGACSKTQNDVIFVVSR